MNVDDGSYHVYYHQPSLLSNTVNYCSYCFGQIIVTSLFSLTGIMGRLQEIIPKWR